MVNNIQGTYNAIGLKKNGQKFFVEIHIKTMTLQGKDVRVAAIRDINQEKK